MKPLYLDEESFNKSISSTIKSISNKKIYIFIIKKTQQILMVTKFIYQK